MSVELHHGDCLDVMAGLEANSIDTVITDPPAGISFMGKKWDNKTGYVAKTDKGMQFLECGELLGLEPWAAGFVAFMIDCLTECYRVMKPGATCLIWALPRTADLTGMAMRVAGLEVRDTVTHLFGSGFPKSANISKNIDKAAGAEREVIGKKHVSRLLPNDVPFGEGLISTQHNKPVMAGEIDITAPSTDLAKLWHGWGTALKPAVEFWLLGMKPRDGTFAHNAEAWGVAGLWVDGVRIATGESTKRPDGKCKHGANSHSAALGTNWNGNGTSGGHASGRFPANLILSHHPDCNGACVEGCPVAMLDAQSGIQSDRPAKKALSGEGSGDGAPKGLFGNGSIAKCGYQTTGGASRFFYCAKSSRSERTCGGTIENGHPTVKPLALMRYFVRLTKTPTGGTVLDPFAGSGSTPCACIEEHRDCIAIEKDLGSFETMTARVAWHQQQAEQLDMFQTFK